MTPLISTPEEIARLLAEAELWIGTPYVPDGAVRGFGCSCSMLPYAILTPLGMDAPHPPRRGMMAKNKILPTMQGYFAVHTEHFEAITRLEDVKAGDIVMFNAGIGHLSVSIGNGQIIHSWQDTGVHYTSIVPESEYGKRFAGAWRPLRRN